MHDDIIYVVDDSKLFCHTHHKLLEKIDNHSTIKKFSNPKHALVHLRKDLKKNSNVSLFLDIEMPAMNGLEMIDYISQSKFLNHGKLSVIIVSSAIKKHLQDDVMKNFLIKDFIQKPLTLDKLTKVFEDKYENIRLEVVA